MKISDRVFWLGWLLLALYCFRAETGHAAPISVDFDSIPLPALTRLVAEEIGKGGYAFTPSFEECSKRVSLRLLGVEASVVEDTVYRLVESEGFTVERGPVVWIQKPVAEVDIIYRPRFRSAAYLAEISAPLFKQGALSVQSAGGVSAGRSTVSTPGVSTAAPGAAGQGAAHAQGVNMSVEREQKDVVAFRGLVADVERLHSVLRQLDVRSPELLVKAVVFEVSKTQGEKSALAIAVSLLGGKVGIKAGAASQGDWSTVFSSASVSAIFDALSTDARFKVVSQPQLRVVSGGTARLTVGTQTPVISGTQMDRNGNALQTVDYKPSGVILDLRPDVLGDVSRLEVDQQISQFQTTTNGVNATPTLITRHLQTSVTMSANEVLVLGGLNEEKSQSSTAGPSWLPSFFRSNSDTRENTEVLIFLEAQRI